MDSYSIYALKQDGKRIPLMLQISDQDAAFYLEEALEIGIGLFHLPVYGDQSLPRDLKTVTKIIPDPKPAPEPLNCKCCGAPLPMPDSPLKGYLVCEHCHVLSLLYGAGSDKPVLGLPKLNSPNSQFEITKMGNRLRIRPREINEDAALILSKTDLGFRVPPSKNILPLGRTELTDIFAKEQELPGPSIGIGYSHADEWAEELAYSGDLEKTHKRIHGTLFYQLIAKTTTGKQICLLDQIRNPYEALAFAGQMRHLYNLAT
jgi:hypothetical protein